MRARSHHDSDSHHGIDLAPMLDFVLNLLIFFIIITSFVKQSGVKVHKPDAVTGEHRDSGNIIIGIQPNGEVWMDRRKVSLPEVRAIIERMHSERPEDTVVITADVSAQTGVMTKVMDEVRAGGVMTVSVATLPGGGGN